MNWRPSSHPISDIRDWNNLNRLELTPDYQRNEVWSKVAQIMLMDTIIKDIPMPKIYVQSIIKEGNTYRKVIDGQQRLKAILLFLENGFKLESPYDGDFPDCHFDQLPDKVKNDFLSYQIDVNEIYDTDDKAIRELYSRVNKYIVPLNKQELRRADFPGDFIGFCEKIADIEFFEEAKIFNAASRRRMNDVEFISEIVASILAGPQNKTETLDDFYLKYSKWGIDERKKLEEEIMSIITDLSIIFDKSTFLISKTRFKQKADFYSLFLAICELKREGGTIEGKEHKYLIEDLGLLDEFIEPNSKIKVLSEYAIQCVSQANTVNSRKWRKDFLKSILSGTYIAAYPKDHYIEQIKQLSLGIYIYECPQCKKEISEDDSQNVILTWKKDENVFQISNSAIIHKDCLSIIDGFY